MISKPRINRDEALCQDRTARHVKRHLERACNLLRENERLGEPFRAGSTLVIPIVRDSGPEEEGRDIRAFASHGWAREALAPENI